MTLVCGIDSSTQSVKAVVCEAGTGEVLRSAAAPHPEGTEVDPAHWARALAQVLGHGLLEGVEALSVAGQQHGMVVLDEAREVVRPALLWNDVRSAGAARALVEELGGPEPWAQAVGSVPVASFTVTKLRWLAEHEPDSAQRAAAVLLPHDWLTSRLLAPDAPLVTDRGDASGTGYFSPATSAWRPDLLERALGRPLELPDVLDPAAPAGEVGGALARELRLDGALVAAGTGDNMAGALGLSAEPGDVVVSLGTSGTAFAVHASPTADATGAVAGFADATGRFLPLVATLNCARVLVVTAALLRIDVAGLSELALSAPPGSGGLVLLPYLDGERTPDLPDATGTLSGITRANLTPACFARAAVEGVLCGLAEAVDRLRDVGVEPRRVLLIGGAARSAAVQAVAPGLFGLPVLVPAPAEYVALGAARQAAWCLTGALPEWPVPAGELEPDDAAGAVRARYREAVTRA